MTRRKMHADEVEVDDDLVHDLVAVQFPEWPDLALRRTPSTGVTAARRRLDALLADDG